MKKLKKTAALLVLCLAAGTFASSGSLLRAGATSSTQQKIDQAEKEKDELENKLDQTNENLDDLKDTQKGLKKELNNLNAQLSQISENLADLEKRISDKEAEIAETQAALEAAKVKESEQYESMVIRIRQMYELNDTSYVNALLLSGSYGEMLNTADNFEKIATYDRKKFQEYKDNRQFIEEEEARLQTEYAELEALKVEVEAEKSKVSGLVGQTSQSIAQYGDAIDEAEAQALAYEAEIKKKEEDLDYLRKKLAEEIAMSQAAANGVWRDISEVTFDEGDRYLLANLIYCEAGGEPYEGQVAVGSVVINRVLSAKYPDSVTGVIYQKSQFSPVASGRLALALASNKATERCYRAADEAMSGVTNVGNCVYFRTPIEGLSGINIGGHVFY